MSASIAYDYLMSFGGSLADHIIPDKTHVISVSFLVESLRKLRGGVGGNISYNLTLLGVRPTLLGAVVRISHPTAPSWIVWASTRRTFSNMQTI